MEKIDSALCQWIALYTRYFNFQFSYLHSFSIFNFLISIHFQFSTFLSPFIFNFQFSYLHSFSIFNFLIFIHFTTQITLKESLAQKLKLVFKFCSIKRQIFQYNFELWVNKNLTSLSQKCGEKQGSAFKLALH